MVKSPFWVGSAPHSTASDDEITGWLGVNNLKETEYHHGILFPAFTMKATSTSIFNLLYMVLSLPFNHGLTVRYAISGRATGTYTIEAWNVFAGEGENSHQWIDTPFPHWWAEFMSLGGKQMALYWGKHGTYDIDPVKDLGR
jgi:hypothetical protein